MIDHKTSLYNSQILNNYILNNNTFKRLHKLFSCTIRGDEQFSGNYDFSVKKYDIVKNTIFQRNGFWYIFHQERHLKLKTAFPTRQPYRRRVNSAMIQTSELWQSRGLEIFPIKIIVLIHKNTERTYQFWMCHAILC